MRPIKYTKMYHSTVSVLARVSALPRLASDNTRKSISAVLTQDLSMLHILTLILVFLFVYRSITTVKNKSDMNGDMRG